MKLVYVDIVCTNYSSCHKTIMVIAGKLLCFYGFIFLMLILSHFFKHPENGLNLSSSVNMASVML